MSDIQSEMRAVAKELLESGEATGVIGWEKGTMPYNSTPVMIRSAADVDKLIWDEYCQQNLSTYLIDFIYSEDKVAIFAKGCDTRAYNRLIQDKRISADKSIIIGVPCSGMKSAKEQYSKCIRCYACRNICPACNCTNCIFDQSASGWQSKDINASENQFYGVTRAFHVAGRCIECGQCEMVCPSDIPIMLMNKKFIKDIDTLFGAYEAGIETEGPTPLSHYEVSDPEEFM